MPHRSLIGSRVRDRRLSLSLSQRQLAQAIGISPSYLNLIEHGKRGIGAGLLTRLADALGADAAVLQAAEDNALIARLAAITPDTAEPVEAIVDRFPVWSRQIAAQADEIAELTQDKAALTERAQYDPALAAALHDVLSIVTSIRSTASILVDGAGDPEWEARFHANIYNDSKRLAQMSQALVEYLDGTRAAQDQVSDAPDPIETRIDRIEVDRAMHRVGSDPAAVAKVLGVGLADAMIAMAGHTDADLPQMGLAACDGAGVMTHYQPCDGFMMARMRGACPLWPLFQALQQPGRPMRHVVAMTGGQSPRLTCYTVADRYEAATFDASAAIRSVMLVVADAPSAAAQTVGPGCATCAAQDCAARREAPRLRL